LRKLNYELIFCQRQKFNKQIENNVLDTTKLWTTIVNEIKAHTRAIKTVTLQKK